MFNRKNTTVILVALCAVLGNSIYYLWERPQLIIPVQNLAEQTEPDLPEIVPINQGIRLGNLQAFSEITQRPLFSFSRQPNIKEIVEKKEVARQPARKPEIDLMGIVIAGESKTALLKTRSNPKLTKIKLEESISGWKVVEIRSKSIKLESAGQQITMKLAKKNKNRNQQISNQRMSIPDIPPMLDPGSPVKDQNFHQTNNNLTHPNQQPRNKSIAVVDP